MSRLVEIYEELTDIHGVLCDVHRTTDILSLIRNDDDIYSPETLMAVRETYALLSAVQEDYRAKALIIYKEIVESVESFLSTPQYDVGAIFSVERDNNTVVRSVSLRISEGYGGIKIEHSALGTVFMTCRDEARYIGEIE